jgi:eukaryotic-like serine/threonine-protein kinase
VNAAALCGIADTAAQHAAGVLNQGPVPRRPEDYPDNSLVWRDACDLLDAQALSDVVPGLGDSEPDPGVADWSCEWSGGDDEPEAELSFFREQPPKSEEDGGYLGQLSGHDAFVEEEGDGSETCTVFVEHRQYPGQGAETAAEMLRLYVDGQQPMPVLCEMATDLAASAAAALRAA